MLLLAQDRVGYNPKKLAVKAEIKRTGYHDRSGLLELKISDKLVLCPANAGTFASWDLGSTNYPNALLEDTYAKNAG